MGYSLGGASIMPKPDRNVSRSSTVTGRPAGTVSSTGAFGRRSTGRPASSGSNRSMGSSSAIRPSWTSVSAATAVTGLVMDVMRKMASGWIGSLPPAAALPTASMWTSPPRLRASARPGTCPVPT